MDLFLIVPKILLSRCLSFSTAHDGTHAAAWGHPQKHIYVYTRATATIIYNFFFQFRFLIQIIQLYLRMVSGAKHSTPVERLFLPQEESARGTLPKYLTKSHQKMSPRTSLPMSSRKRNPRGVHCQNISQNHIKK